MPDECFLIDTAVTSREEGDESDFERVRIRPESEKGTAVGFRIDGIAAGGFYAALGIQNGDVIMKINDYEMTSPEKALDAYTQAKDQPVLSVELKRRGLMRTQWYIIH